MIDHHSCTHTQLTQFCKAWKVVRITATINHVFISFFASAATNICNLSFKLSEPRSPRPHRDGESEFPTSAVIFVLNIPYPVNSNCKIWRFFYSISRFSPKYLLFFVPKYPTCWKALKELRGWRYGKYIQTRIASSCIMNSLKTSNDLPISNEQNILVNILYFIFIYLLIVFVIKLLVGTWSLLKFIYYRRSCRFFVYEIESYFC